MKGFNRVGATIALLSASVWWAIIAVFARTAMASADTVRDQLLWLLLGTAAIIAASFFVYLSLVLAPADEELGGNLAAEYLSWEETERNKRDS